jgi:hypothetical protein
MFRRLIEIGSYFDWITPLVAYLKDWANGPAHTFGIPENCGWSAFEIQRLLRQNGVKTWGVMIVKGTIIVSMRLAQAHWAQYLLERERIPIEAGLLEGRPVSQSQRTTRPRFAQAAVRPRTGIWAELAQTLHEIADEIASLFRA